MIMHALPERSDVRGSDGQLTYEAKAWNQCLDACEPLVSELLAELQRVQARRKVLLNQRFALAIRLKRLTEMLSDDAFAISFQAFGQYRAALLEAAAPDGERQ